MIGQDLGEYLVNNIPGARLVSGGREVLCRCPRCGDSSNYRSAHFYISLGDKYKPPMYHCFKCNEGGIFDFGKLRWFDLYDTHIGTELNEYVKTFIKRGNSINVFTGVYNICNSKITYDEVTKAKLKYINTRLGLNLTPEEAIQKKIVLNLGDLLSGNNITKYSRSPEVVKELDEKFIGFLSYDNAYLNMRNLCPDNSFIDKRYINYNIFNKIDNSMMYYILPNQIDLTNPEPIKLRIAEGPFDVLGIYYNVVQRMDQNIYAAIGGKGYLNIIKFFLEQLGLINIEIHLYPDKDIHNGTLYKIVNYITPLKIPITIHRNTFDGEKDYGVPKERIKDTIISL